MAAVAEGKGFAVIRPGGTRMGVRYTCKRGHMGHCRTPAVRPQRADRHAGQAHSSNNQEQATISQYTGAHAHTHATRGSGVI